MSKTWYGHHIETIKGEDYVLFKDYLELDKKIEKLNKELIKKDEGYKATIKELCEVTEENEELKIENEKLTQLWLDSQEKRRKAIKYLVEHSRWKKSREKYGIKGKIEEERIATSDLLKILNGDDTN